MNIEVTKGKNKRYLLKINGEYILTHDKLSSIMLKIEEYLKMRFLEPEERGGVSGFLDKLTK